MIETYTTSEAAEVLKCSPDQVRALILSGRLHATNTSLGAKRARWVITQQSIEAFLTPKERTAKPRGKRKANRRSWIA